MSRTESATVLTDVCHTHTHTHTHTRTHAHISVSDSASKQRRSADTQAVADPENYCGGGAFTSKNYVNTDYMYST